MAQYENGVETTRRILDACRILFYEKGYNATSFVDIAELAGVNKSAIHYHLKSKENILSLIVNNETAANNAVASPYFTRDTVPLAKYLFSGEIYNYKLYHDSKYLRFFCETMNIYFSGNLTKNVGEMAKLLFWDDESKVVLLTDAHFHELLAIMGYTNGLLAYMASNPRGYTLQGINQYSCEMHRRILDVGESEYKLVQAQLADMERRCDWDSIDTSFSAF